MVKSKINQNLEESKKKTSLTQKIWMSFAVLLFSEIFTSYIFIYNYKIYILIFQDHLKARSSLRTPVEIAKLPLEHS